MEFVGRGKSPRGPRSPKFWKILKVFERETYADLNMQLLSVALNSEAIYLGTERGVWRERIIVQESYPANSVARRRTVIKRASNDEKFNE